MYADFLLLLIDVCGFPSLVDVCGFPSPVCGFPSLVDACGFHSLVCGFPYLVCEFPFLGSICGLPSLVNVCGFPSVDVVPLSFEKDASLVFCLLKTMCQWCFVY